MSVNKFDHELFGKLDVYVNEEGTVYFLCKQVAGLLSYESPDKAYKHCKSLISLKNAKLGELIKEGVHPASKLILEKDIYRLVMRSHKPEAEVFEDWVMEEVLPTIRKTGGMVSDIDQIMDTFYKNEPEEVRAIIRSGLVYRKENQHKVDFANEVSETVGYKDMNSVAKALGLGRNTMFRYLRNLNILMTGNSPYQQYVTQGYFKVNQVTKGGKLYNVTLVSGKGEVWLYKRLKQGEYLS